MTKRKPMGRARAPAEARGVSRWPSVTRLAVMALVVVLGGAAWWAWQQRSRPSPVPREDASHPASRLSPENAYDAALRLSVAGEHIEALPYYRRALDGVPGDYWMTHCNYATGLYNATIEARGPYGLGIPAVRSSVERVAMVRAALEHLEMAERLARSPADHAEVVRRRGDIFAIWGLPWDTFGQLRQAQLANPGSPELDSRVAGIFQVLRHPDISLPTASTVRTVPSHPGGDPSR